MAQYEDPEKRSAKVPEFFGSGRFASAVVTFTIALLAGISAEAQSSVEIERRIKAAFDLVLEDSLVTPHDAIPRRSSEGSKGVSPLPYAGRTAEPPTDPKRDVELARLPRPRPQDPIMTENVTALESLPVGTSVGEADFLNRFAGSFSGSGQVQRKASESPNQVRCTISGQPSTNGVSMSGKCGAFVFSRKISAEISYDPASDRYSGVYVGAASGPAKLSGRRYGDAVVLTITWPKPVNGDTHATMTIRNSGSGKLVITVTDELHPGGPEAEVTRLAFNQL